jgi:hypothetical protein
VNGSDYVANFPLTPPPVGYPATGYPGVSRRTTQWQASRGNTNVGTVIGYGPIAGFSFDLSIIDSPNLNTK